MEKDEIKALINREVTKQGRNIMGGGLSSILNAILDAIPEGGSTGGGSLVLACDLGDNYTVSLESGSKADVASMFGITENDVDRLLNGEFAFLNVTSRKGGQTRVFGAPATEIYVGNTVSFRAEDVSFYLGYTDGAYYGDCNTSWPK